MIAFVVPVADRDRYERIAAPGLDLVREPDSLVLALDGPGTVQARLNAALDELAALPDLEVAVVLHEDLRITDVDAAAVLRRAFVDETVAIAGVIGARDVQSLAWWEGEGVGRVGTPHVPAGAVWGAAPRGDVDVVDGILLALSPWAVRTLRFDEQLGEDFHGYDADLCFQARHHGRRVVVVELAAVHEHGTRFAEPDRWARNELRFRQRWVERRLVSQERHRSLTSGSR